MEHQNEVENTEENSKSPGTDNIVAITKNEPKTTELIENLHSFELFRDYTLPEWSAKPARKYMLEVIKEGTIVEEIDISQKEFYLIGKLPDLCDIVLQHMSISRKHTVLQHSKTGEVFLYDLVPTEQE